MAAYDAGTDISGGSTVTVGAAYSVVASSDPLGDSSVSFDPTLISSGVSDCIGGSSLGLDALVSRFVDSSPEGDSDLSAQGTYWLYADAVEGDSSVSPAGVVSATAESVLDGDAELATNPTGAYVGASSMTGDGSLAPTSSVQWTASALTTGDAVLEATPLGEFEFASDLLGDSSVGADTDASYEVALSLGGESSFRCRAIIRKPQVQIPTPEDESETVRLVGYQPGRTPPEYRESLVIETNRRRRR